jgi:hypothetical protein
VLTITNVRNLPSLQTRSTFGISTADSSGNLIDSCSGLFVILQFPASLNAVSYSRMTGNNLVNQLGTYFFYIKVSNPIPKGGKIQIFIPPELVLTASLPSFIPQVNADAGTVSSTGVTGWYLISNAITNTYISDSILFSLGNI